MTRPLGSTRRTMVSGPGSERTSKATGLGRGALRFLAPLVLVRRVVLVAVLAMRLVLVLERFAVRRRAVRRLGGDEVADGAVGARQVLLGHALHIGGGDGGQAVEVAVEPLMGIVDFCRAQP